MSSFKLKTINMTLDPKSISRAVREINRFADDIEQICEDLTRKLVAQGIEIARMQVVSMDAVLTDQLEQSIQGVYFKEERCGIVYTDIPYALFVEFGTGIVGKQGYQHPMLGKVGWQHDINEHGTAGWWYPADFGWYIPKGTNVKLAWTKGMEARPFMYETLGWLEEVAKREGIKMFKSYAKGGGT